MKASKKILIPLVAVFVCGGAFAVIHSLTRQNGDTVDSKISSSQEVTSEIAPVTNIDSIYDMLKNFIDDKELEAAIRIDDRIDNNSDDIDDVFENGEKMVFITISSGAYTGGDPDELNKKLEKCGDKAQDKIEKFIEDNAIDRELVLIGKLE